MQGRRVRWGDPSRFGGLSRSSFVILLCLILRTGLCAQDPAPGQSEVRQIHGVVVNGVTHRPVGRALVTSQDQRLAAMTDDEGRFTFDFRTPQGARPNADAAFTNLGQVRAFYQAFVVLVARKPGYLPMMNPELVNLGDGKTEEDLRLTLMPEAIIKGTVAASGAVAPHDITVNLLQRSVQDGLALWVQMQSKRTNGRGEFRFAELAAGDYRVTTQEWMENGAVLPVRGRGVLGYAPVRYPEGVDTASALHVGAGETRQADLDLRAEPYTRVQIAVQGTAQGEPFSVEVVRADGLAGFSLGMNAGSHMLEGFLPNGTYDVRLESYSQTPLTAAAVISVAGRPVEASIVAHPRGATPVVVREEYTAAAAGQSNSGPGGPGAPGGAVTFGQQQQNRPIDLEMISVSDGGRAGLRMDAAGKREEGLAIDGARPGRYHLRVNPHRGYVASMTSGGTDLLHEDLVIGPEGVAAPIEITLRDDGATLSGMVTGLTAAGGGGILAQWPSLFCLPTGHDAAQVTAGSAGADGRFSIENLAPGQYRVIAFRHREENLEYRNEDAMHRFDTKGVLVTLAAGQKAEIDVPVLTGEDE